MHKFYVEWRGTVDANTAADAETMIENAISAKVPNSDLDECNAEPCDDDTDDDDADDPLYVDADDAGSCFDDND